MNTFEAFAALHVPGKPLVLVNAWDVCSALALAAAGHPAIGTTSLGITAAAGLPDGAGLGRELTTELATRLQGRLQVPLTIDLESGYSDEPSVVSRLVSELAVLGVAGVNLEDADRTAAAHGAIVAAVRAVNDRVFLNARVDEFWSGHHNLAEALERGKAYRDAGAHGLFVPGLTDPGGVEAVAQLGLPLNILWQPGLDLRDTAAARVSTGSALYRAALAAALASGDAARSNSPPRPAVTYSTVQALLRSDKPTVESVSNPKFHEDD